MSINVVPPRQFISLGRCVYVLKCLAPDALTYRRYDNGSVVTVYKTVAAAAVAANALNNTASHL